jgi:vacuolar-type H+-ATPase subunit F/Vma7
MSGIVAIGDRQQLEGFALVGVPVVIASTPAGYDAAWNHLPADTGMVILSSDAAEALGARWVERPDTLVAVMP